MVRQIANWIRCDYLRKRIAYWMPWLFFGVALFGVGYGESQKRQALESVQNEIEARQDADLIRHDGQLVRIAEIKADHVERLKYIQFLLEIEQTDEAMVRLADVIEVLDK